MFFLAVFEGGEALPHLAFPGPSPTLIRQLNGAEDFLHAVGQAGSKGWELDYRRDKPGYALSGLKDPLLLEPGLYRATFEIRRGHYPNKGLFHPTFGLFRLEIWDGTANERVITRELQIDDFSRPNQYEPRWVEFSMSGREGHVIEPRVYWIGLGNGEIASIKFERTSSPSLKELENKAYRLGDRLEGIHLENGFVVSRKPSGEPDETGDATTYTSFYVASLAWKYAVTQDEMTYQALENGLATLHNAVKGNADYPVLTRFVNDDGTPFPKSPSKDVYTSFFLAYSAAYPHIRNVALKKQMETDVERIGARFLTEGLKVNGGSKSLLNLAPHFTPDDVREGIQTLLADKKYVKKTLKAIKQANRILPFAELWPGMKEVVKALQKRDEKLLYSQVVPVMNGIIQLVERIRDLLREQYRVDLFPKRIRRLDYPGRQLLELIGVTLKKLPAKKNNNKRFERLSDLRVLASNAVLSLHIVGTAYRMTNRSHFEDYYRTNLFTQDELLKTAVDWFGFEEDFIRLTVGNSAANRHRRGYLTMLALYNLIQIESNPVTKTEFQSLLRREWEAYRHEDNPLVEAISAACGQKANVDLILRDLNLYPEERTGFGAEYWKENGKAIAEEWGGGESKGFSREPLPVSLRPKDSFLWQRNARRLKGDELKEYPGTDYLFLYWFCRYHKLISAPPAEPSVYLK